MVNKEIERNVPFFFPHLLHKDKDVTASDIVLIAYNNLELTRKCLESIFKHFRWQDNLIIVDNGSDKQTCDYLQELKQRNQSINIELIRLEPNQGFIKAANVGLKKSRKEFVCILCNDTVVTQGWLEKMCFLMQTNSDIGIINPLSNTFGVYPSKNQGIEALARSIEVFKGNFKETASCVGFCMLIRQTVIQKIGYLDEVFGKGYFEDTDYSRRAIVASFKCVIAQDAYVWHQEHSTFKSRQREELFKRNREIFHQRWGKPIRILCVVKQSLKDSTQNQQVTEFILLQARQGNWLWVIVSKAVKDKTKKLEIHSNIRIIAVSDWLFWIYPLYLILVKRKKKIELVFLDKGVFIKLAKMLKLVFKNPIKEITYGF